MFRPGSEPEAGWRCGGSGWEVRMPEGGGSRFSAEPDVCRALTGVAEGAVPERGKLWGLGFLWVGYGSGKTWPGHLKEWGPGRGDPSRSKEGKRGWNWAWWPGLSAAGILPHFGACREKTTSFADFFLPSPGQMPG